LGVPDPIGVRFADLEKSWMTCLRESAQENLVTPNWTLKRKNSCFQSERGLGMNRKTMVHGFLALLLWLGVMMPGTASGVDLTISSSTFAPGDNLITLAVQVTNPSGSAVGLAAFSLQLEVTPTGPRRMEFDSGSQPQTLTDPDYVFYSDSAAQTGAITPWSISNGAGVNAEYTFTDTTKSTNDIVLGANESRLLALVQLKPGAGAATPILGDQFQVSFMNAGTSLVDATLSLVPFTTGFGTITVVPEPGTRVLGTISVAATLTLGNRRRKHYVSSHE